MGRANNILPDSQLLPRPPIVTVMGHIDHGKTTLLDKIRQTNLAQRETGGITQHIGASFIVWQDKQGHRQGITFIDTPGHAAFAKMRARGAKVTDLVVLVVAADDGVKQQTRECLDHIRAAGVPFLVALNKVDLPTARVDQVKAELAEIGVVPEEYGGKTVVVPVSAKTGQGISELLEMIVLLAQVSGIEGKASEPLEAVVIESRLDKRVGPLATVLVRRGQITIGEEIFAEGVKGKVRAIIDDRGKRIEAILPGFAGEILGFEAVPPVGSQVTHQPTPPKKVAGGEQKAIVGSRQKDDRLPVLIKADTQGTLEAVVGGLPGGVKLVGSGVGDVSETDVFLAQTTKATILAFGVRATPAAKTTASQSGVSIFTFNLIYELFDKLKELLEKKKEAEEEVIFGKAQIIAEFKVGKKKIAGCRVIEGVIKRNFPARILRQEKVIGETKIVSLRHFKEDISEANSGQECGMIFEPAVDFVLGDVVLSYKPAKGTQNGH